MTVKNLIERIVDLQNRLGEVSRQLSMEQENRNDILRALDDVGAPTNDGQKWVSGAERVRLFAKQAQKNKWSSMDSAPLDGRHCILAIPSSGGFIYSAQGAYHGDVWNSCMGADVKPLAWMPNILLPNELAPWKNNKETV